MSPSTWPQNGPAITWVSSRTRSPSSALEPKAGSRSSCAIAASTPLPATGTPARRSPISTPHSVPISMRSLKSPRWPIRNTRPASLPSPAPSDMSKRSRMILRTASASGVITAVNDAEYSRSSRHSTSRPHAPTAARVAAACRWWRANTFSSPSSRSMAIASRRP